MNITWKTTGPHYTHSAQERLFLKTFISLPPHLHRMLGVLGERIQLVKQRFAELRDHALLSRFVWLSHHRVRLARPRLAIRKDADVVALEGMIQELFSDVIVHHLLSREQRIGWLEGNAKTLLFGLWCNRTRDIRINLSLGRYNAKISISY